MKLRTIALALALSLSISLLSACAGGSSNQQPETSAPGSDVSAPADSQTPDSSSPDASAPDASTPEESAPDASSQPESTPEAEPAPTLTLNKSDFTLFKAGDSYKLKATATGTAGAGFVWSSSDEGVATVSEDGKVTAVAPGTATITVQCSDLSATCVVRCKFEADTPASGSGSSSNPGNSGSSSSGSGSSASNVDLAAFYSTLSGKYEFPSSMALADQEIMDNFFPGLGGVSTQQCLVYANMMSMNMGELALVQVTDSKDVSTVKSILQGRIDYMVEGGAWYPAPTELWTNSSRVVSNGNYILMVVSANCNAIVADFNALF